MFNNLEINNNMLDGRSISELPMLDKSKIYHRCYFYNRKIEICVCVQYRYFISFDQHGYLIFLKINSC